MRAEQQKQASSSNKQQQAAAAADCSNDRTHGGEVGGRVVSKKKGSGRVVAQNGSTAGGREERKGGERQRQQPPSHFFLPPTPHPARLVKLAQLSWHACLLAQTSGIYRRRGCGVLQCCTGFSVFLSACLSLYVCPAPPYTPSYHSATLDAPHWVFPPTRVNSQKQNIEESSTYLTHTHIYPHPHRYTPTLPS